MRRISFKEFVAFVTDVIFQNRSKIVFTIEDVISENDARLNALCKSNLFSVFLKNDREPTKDKLKDIRKALKIRFRYHLFPEQFKFDNEKEFNIEKENLRSFMDRVQLFFGYFFGMSYYNLIIQDEDTPEIINSKKEYCCNLFNQMVDVFENNNSIETGLNFFNGNMIVTIRTDDLITKNMTKIKDFTASEVRYYQERFCKTTDEIKQEKRMNWSLVDAYFNTVSREINERINLIIELLNKSLENKLEVFNTLEWNFNYNYIYKEMTFKIITEKESIAVSKMKYYFNVLEQLRNQYSNGIDDNMKIVNSEQYISFMNEICNEIRYHDFNYMLRFYFVTLNDND